MRVGPITPIAPTTSWFVFLNELTTMETPAMLNKVLFAPMNIWTPSAVSARLNSFKTSSFVSKASKIVRMCSKSVAAEISSNKFA